MITHKNNIYAVPPGETLKEWMINFNVSFDELKYRMHYQTDIELDNLLEGITKIDKCVAYDLYKATSIPISFWLNMEDQYRDDLRLIKQK